MNSWRFFRRVWFATAPLAVWGTHFLFCYVLVAVQCTVTRTQSTLPLWLATALGVGMCGWMLWQGRSALRGEADLASQVRAVAALLATIAIAWNAFPLLLLDGCG